MLVNYQRPPGFLDKRCRLTIETPGGEEMGRNPLLADWGFGGVS